MVILASFVIVSFETGTVGVETVEFYFGYVIDDTLAIVLMFDVGLDTRTISYWTAFVVTYFFGVDL